MKNLFKETMNPDIYLVKPIEVKSEIQTAILEKLHSLLEQKADPRIKSILVEDESYLNYKFKIRLGLESYFFYFSKEKSISEELKRYEEFLSLIK